jgi:hypothetical protein
MQPGSHESEILKACRQKAREYINNANKTRAEPKVSARWSELAEQLIRESNALIERRASMARGLV